MGGYNITDIIASIKYGLYLDHICVCIYVLLACCCQEIYNCPYFEVMAIFIFILSVFSDLELSVCEIYISRLMVYTTLNIICSKTTAPICILSKLDCGGCGCTAVNFDVFGLFYVSVAVKWSSQTHLPKSKN